MSRVGRLPIPVPQGVEVKTAGSEVTVRGPKGELSRHFHPDLSIDIKDNSVTISRPKDDRVHRALHGLTRSLVANMVEGVANGFEKNLEIVGVGYRAQQNGDKLVLRVGYTHPVEISPPPGVSLAVEGPTRVKVIGINKELVGQVAADIRTVRPPDSYKGKGIKYVGERIRLKTGKAMRKRK
ncbi:50S ribosomal protein L6 [Chloroflexota bacterium]